MSTPLDAVPGAEDLTRAARMLGRLDLAAPDRVRADLAGVADGLVTTPSALRPSPDAAWAGPGADAYAAWVHGVARACASTESAVRSAAGELERVGTALRDAAREVDDQVAHAVDAVDRARLAAGPGGPGPEALRAAVAGPAAAARTAVARVEQELSDAVARLRGHTASLDGFSRLPAPDAGRIASPPTASALPAAPTASASTSATPAVTSVPSAVTSATPVATSSVASSAPSAATRVVTRVDGGDRPGATTSADPAAVPVRPADDLAAPLVPDAAPAVPAPAVATPPGPPAPAGVTEWIRAARAVLTAAGVPAEKTDPDAIAMIIAHESGGDPNAVNGGDANAARGTPSQGLMQTIGPTFRAYRLPGHDDIRNPVDNIIAGVRYAVARYGSVSRVPGVVALRAGRAYVGY